MRWSKPETFHGQASFRDARWHLLNQKFLFGSILVGLASEDFGIFYGHLVNFTAAIWYNLWSFG
jgi:hypothetical protein